MKRVCKVLVLVVVLSSASVFAQDKAAQEAIETEKKRVQYLIRDDLVSLAGILADDLTYTHSSGVLDTKDQFLASLRSGEVKYEMIEHESINARTYGDTAVLTGRSKVKVKVKGQDLNMQLRFTLVYVKREGGWQMAAWQSTRLPAE